MKKLIIFVLTIVTVISMTIPAHAATPSLKVPEVPQISRLDFKVTLGEDFWTRYWEKRPINIGEINWTKLTKPAEPDTAMIKALQKLVH